MNETKRHAAFLIAIALFGLLCLAARPACAKVTKIADAFTRTGPGETVTAPFNAPGGGTTVGVYSGLIEIVVSGTGRAAGSQKNDAFYLMTGGAHRSGTGGAQINLGFGSSYNSGLDGNIQRLITFIDGVGQVSSGTVPPYSHANTYDFVISLTATDKLTFGVAGDYFSDNIGAYTVHVYPVTPRSAPGSRLWYRNDNDGGSDFESAVAAAADAQGDVIVTGVASHPGTGEDFLTIKYDGVTGATLWSRHYNGPANSRDAPVAIATDVNGDVFVAGVSANPNLPDGESDDDFQTFKYDGKTGATLWSRRYSSTSPNGYGTLDQPSALAVDAAGNVFVTGSTDGGPSHGDDFQTLKYDGTTGATLWSRRYDGSPVGQRSQVSAATGIALDADDNVIVTGRALDDDNGYGFATIKYDGSTGDALWSRRSPAPPFTIAPGQTNLSLPYPTVRVAVDADGAVVVAGTVTHSVLTQANISDVKVLKYDGATGASLWSRVFDGGANDDVQGLGLDASGNAYLADNSFGGGAATDGFVTLRLSGASGHVQWSRLFATINTSSAEGHNQIEGPRALVVDPATGVVYVGGASDEFPGSGSSPMEGDRFRTLSYDGATGDLRWTQVFPHGDGSPSGGFVSALALDPLGGLFVAGQRPVADIGHATFTTLKYSP